MPLDHFTLKYTTKWISLRSQMRNWMIPSYKMAIHQWIFYYDPPWNENSLKAIAMFLLFKIFALRDFLYVLFSCLLWNIVQSVSTLHEIFQPTFSSVHYWFLVFGSWLHGPLQQIHFVNLLVATFFSFSSSNGVNLFHAFSFYLNFVVYRSPFAM